MRSSGKGQLTRPNCLGKHRNTYARRKADCEPRRDMEAAWREFYDLCSDKIGRFALACHLSENDVPDCAQEVWRELFVRLPLFRLDLQRGQFDSWLDRITR